MTFFSLCHDDLFPCTCTPVFSFSSYKETRPFGLGTPTIGLSFYLITYLRTLSPNMVKFCYTRGWDLNVWIFVVVQLCLTLLQPHVLWSTRLLCPWNFPGKNTGVVCHFIFQGIFPTQGSNPCLLCLLHWQVDSLPLRHQGSHMNSGVTQLSQ